MPDHGGLRDEAGLRRVDADPDVDGGHGPRSRARSAGGRSRGQPRADDRASLSPPAGEDRRGPATDGDGRQRRRGPRVRHRAGRRPRLVGASGRRRLAREEGRAPRRRPAGGFPGPRLSEAGRRHLGPRRGLSRADAGAAPLLAATRLEQRPERAGPRAGRVSPVLPAQPVWLGLGQHALGPRRQPRPGALARGTDRSLSAKLRRLGVQRQRGR